MLKIFSKTLSPAFLRHPTGQHRAALIDKLLQVRGYFNIKIFITVEYFSICG